MNQAAKFLNRLADILGYVSGWLVPIMVALVAVEVFMRYILQAPPMVADEFSAYLLVCVSYLGMAYTWRQGGHVRITILVSRLPVKVASYVRLIVLLLIFFFMIGITKAGYDMVVYAHEIGLRSDTWLTFPLFWPQLAVFLGFLVFLLLLPAEIFRVIGKIRSGEPVEDRIK
jgi:TRAP-type C4-dicarboxylate transport system permease small subunit